MDEQNIMPDDPFNDPVFKVTGSPAPIKWYNGGWFKWVVFAIAILIIALLAVIAWKTDKPKAATTNDDYKLIYLDNNQVIVARMNGKILTSVYYLTAVQTATGTQLSLNKATDGQLKPIDETELNMDKIVLIQTLASDSPVVQQIKNPQQ